MRMKRNRKEIPGVFWQDGYGFRCEDEYRNVDLPSVASSTVSNFIELAKERNILPDLGDAPIASWLLARLSFLADIYYPFRFGQKIGSDGENYWLRFYCLSEDSEPIGMLSVLGKEQEIVVSCSVSTELVSPKEIVTSFIDRLLENPDEIEEAKVTVICTEMSDTEVSFKIPKVYGWDEDGFIFEQSPKDTIDPSEYESTTSHWR